MNNIIEKIEKDVVLQNESLATLLDINCTNNFSQQLYNYNLSIPDYQRIYCWEEKQIIKLLEDLINYTERDIIMALA